jgi:lipopolysaccharide/colanic/teichoic acid biosynthesis glycosyltransferase
MRASGLNLNFALTAWCRKHPRFIVESWEGDPGQFRPDAGDPAKRGFDFLLAGMGLCLSSPIWLLVSALIVMEDGFPVFFRQKRWGKGGRTFGALKFRTMWKGSEKERSVQAGHDDPRITRVGRLLRACAMDELPQLWNIFIGDMSFVGPRALPINEIQSSAGDKDIPDEAIPGFKERLAVRPGLTGIAQIFADRDTSRARKFRYDLFYIRRRNFWLDLRLILLSFYISFRGRWEVRGEKLK